jgi:hypothetical protein
MDDKPNQGKPAMFCRGKITMVVGGGAESYWNHSFSVVLEWSPQPHTH